MLRVVYEPKGRAGEYANLACNIYSGCDHACTYCYAPLATRTPRDRFCEPRERVGLLDKLQKDALELATAGDKRSILLCFTCDPYQTLDTYHMHTRSALKILLAAGLNVTILTKGGKRSRRDFDLFRAHPDQVTYAATLTFLDDEQRIKYEPGAAHTTERIVALKDAHDLGVKTWASLEPVFDPEQSLDLIRYTHEFVDLYKVGKLNYMPEAKNIDWGKFAHDAVSLLESLGKDYYIKDDLKKYL